MAERDGVVIGEAAKIRMVGYHRRDLYGKGVNAPAEQEVVEAVPELAHHDEHALPFGVRQAPCHAEHVRYRRELEAQRTGADIAGNGGHELHPHEKGSCFSVVELLALGNVALLLDEEF